MPVCPSVLAELLPGGSGGWEPVAGGESGASVFYDRATQRYAKVVSSERVAELAGERDRSLWISQTTVPSVPVLDWRQTDDVGRLGTADPYGDIALLLATARENWPDEATARQADRQFAQVYRTQLDPERQDFYLRLDPLTW